MECLRIPGRARLRLGLISIKLGCDFDSFFCHRDPFRVRRRWVKPGKEMGVRQGTWFLHFLREREIEEGRGGGMREGEKGKEGKRRESGHF